MYIDIFNLLVLLAIFFLASFIRRFIVSTYFLKSDLYLVSIFPARLENNLGITTTTHINNIIKIINIASLAQVLVLPLHHKPEGKLITPSGKTHDEWKNSRL